MPRPIPLLAALVMATTVTWSLAFAFESGRLARSSLLLIAADQLLLALVAVGGLLIARGRWARWLAVGLLGFQLVLLAFRPADAWTVVTVALALPALVMLLVPAVTASWLRQRRSADGPTPGVVVVLLGLLASPTAAGLAAADGLEVMHWVFAVAAIGFAWAFSRAMVAGLWATRVAYPVLGILAAITSPPAGAIALVAYVAAVTALAWRREALLAVQPLSPPRVPVYPIPAELAPGEVLGAAGYDDAGRRAAETKEGPS